MFFVSWALADTPKPMQVRHVIQDQQVLITWVCDIAPDYFQLVACDNVDPNKDPLRLCAPVRDLGLWLCVLIGMLHCFSTHFQPFSTCSHAARLIAYSSFFTGLDTRSGGFAKKQETTYRSLVSSQIIA